MRGARQPRAAGNGTGGRHGTAAHLAPGDPEAQQEMRAHPVSKGATPPAPLGSRVACALQMSRRVTPFSVSIRALSSVQRSMQCWHGDAQRARDLVWGHATGHNFLRCP